MKHRIELAVRQTWRPRVLLAITWAVACLALPAQALAPPSTDAVWWGVVVYVIDGDTVRVRPADGGKPVSLRIDGIDAPEICQDGGVASRDALKAHTFKQRVAVHGTRRDNYGRLLAPIDVNGEDVGRWMVENGQAWSYRFRGNDGPYAQEELRARAARRGMFARGQAMPQEPRLFRKQHGTCYFPG